MYLVFHVLEETTDWVDGHVALVRIITHSYEQHGRVTYRVQQDG